MKTSQLDAASLAQISSQISAMMIPAASTNLLSNISMKPSVPLMRESMDQHHPHRLLTHIRQLPMIRLVTEDVNKYICFYRLISS